MPLRNICKKFVKKELEFIDKALKHPYNTNERLSIKKIISIGGIYES